jgi:hypothetical protein
MEYREFRLVIKSPTDITAKRTEYNYETDTVTSYPEIKGTQIFMDILRKQTIDMFGHWLEKNKVDQRDEFVVLGTNLYEALFGDPNIRSAFEAELVKYVGGNSNPPLRLVLEFETQADKLAQLPWEFLHCPMNEGYFLGARTNLILARHTPKPWILDEAMLKVLKPKPGQLRILMVISSPEYEEVEDLFDKSKKVLIKLPEISGAEELRSTIVNKLKGAEIKMLRQPIKSVFERTAETFEPHVLHFIGHGKNGRLALVQDKNKRSTDKNKSLAEWITDASFADCFEHYQPPLVFLHACQGAMSSSYEMFKGLALKLMQARIPTVVAMQFEVEVGEASRFATRFYEELSRGRSIDEAVQRGREELGTGKNEPGQQNYSNRAFGCPVVYIRNCSREIVLVQAQQMDNDEGPAPTPPVEATRQSRCPGCGIPLSIYAKFCKNKDCTAGELTQCPECGQLMEKNSRCISCGFMEVPTNRERVTAMSVLARNSQRPPADAVGR